MARKTSSVGYSFPITIGVIVAVVAITQKNYGGAVFAVVAGLLLALFMFVRSRRVG